MVKPKQKPAGEGNATRGPSRQGRTEGREEQTMNAAGGWGAGNRGRAPSCLLAWLCHQIALPPLAGHLLSPGSCFSHLKMKRRTEIYEVKDDLYPLFPFQSSMA